ncbi:DUF4179 domain-containing protein [Paenibacillus sp. MMS18-CY102]|uniref:DUF4179 domain-containing protein n=1 Tax=Paenibacillus sp. MMS18-CY102 TaxID=2682849 RepID=UPI001365A128|nr:DUF4179 domain-containing protein [Paenibacillus sp. MMS18-CY102]MWC30022.1 DUF4179 domain-containing protein [Paenibacillus sp. MMS18-CY102]
MKRTEWDNQLSDRLRKQRRDVPAEIHEGIERVLASLPEREWEMGGNTKPRRLYRSWVAAASALLLLAGSMFIFTGSNSFAEAVKQKLHSIFYDSGTPALVEEGKNQNGEMGVLLEKSDKGYTLRVHEIMYDGQRLSLSYSLAKQVGKPQSQWIKPIFKLDASMKKGNPNIIGTDSGNAGGDEKLGIVNYYFTGDAPEQFNLKINVPALVFDFHDVAKQSLYQGNWSFEIPVKKKGEPLREVAKAELPKADDQGVHFEVRQVRMASRSTLWRLYWEYPSELRPSPLLKGTPRYGMNYVLEAAGKKLTVSLDYTSGGRVQRDGKVVDGMMYEMAMFVTEQLPKGVKEVTVTPILLKITQGAKLNKPNFVETPLQSFVLKVPI